MTREELFKGFAGCLNYDCVVKGEFTGLHTNAGCQCLINASRSELRLLQNRLNVYFNKLEQSE